jgi:cobalt-zinc-cadmium efflux system outer membrane protein
VPSQGGSVVKIPRVAKIPSFLRLVAVVLASVVDLPSAAFGQGPTVEPGDAARVREETSLGPVPGSGGTRGGAPADAPSILSGRLGPSVPRVTSDISRPGAGLGMAPTEGITLPPPLPITELPVYGPLSVPAEAADDGPPDGLTIDQAIDRLIRDNLDLQAQFHEIPKARADILTASLRANPVFYADTQLIPYGRFSEERPGGPVQYDINISYPLDLSHKRQARMAVASQAKRVIEAQYQDAVRLQIDALYQAYVQALAARETLRYAEASTAGLTRLLEQTQRLLRGGERSRGDVDRVQIQLDAAQIGLADAQEALRAALRQLGPLIRIRPTDAEALELRGTIEDRAPPPPSSEELIELALNNRPDLISFRLGVGLAQADVRLAYAERYQDVYVLYQPYTFQDNSVFDRRSARSWAVGVTVPLPLYNRNQGNIQRAQINVSQTRTQLAAVELRVLTEVRQAERDYQVSRAAVRSIERELLPGARRVRDETFRRYTQGEVALVDYLLAQREYNDIVRQYRDTQVRHRRNMLTLNTAVGVRILP